MIIIKQSILFFISLFLFSDACAQKQTADYLNWFDTTVGIQNTPIFEGIGYVEQFKSINEKHKFYISPDFVKGSIAYDGQEYYHLSLKYDLFVDEVIVNLKDGFEAVALQPEKNKISDFTIHGNNFENIGPPKNSDPQISGFFEILFSSPSLSLLKKHRKKRFKKIGKLVYYEFRDDNFNVLRHKNGYHIVDSNKDFRKLFPAFRKEIKKYKIKKSNKDEDMKALLKRLSLLMSNENIE